LPTPVDRDHGLQEQLRRVLAIGRALVDEHDPATVLDRILAEARSLTGARYAALGVMNEDRTGLERFITSGIDEDGRRAIGELPRGRGVLGVLIRDPWPLRLTDVGAHPESYGFPAGHPPMHAFLGVPIVIRGHAWGNLYLTEKTNGEAFSEEDEEAVTNLAAWAATAIDNARLFDVNERRRLELERAVQALEAARDIADATGQVDDLDSVLELVAKRGRALVEARTLLIMIQEGDELVIAASAGHGAQARGRRLPIAASSAGRVLERGTAQRVDDVTLDLRIAPADFGVPDARRGLTVPLQHRGAGIGVLVAFDRGPEQAPFTEEDEGLLRTFAASAANAIALNRSVTADRLRSAIAAAEAERGRWARELHDQTLQSLGALRVGLASIRGGLTSDEAARSALTETIGDVETEIASLRAIIADLRPAILDDLGLIEALDALLDRHRSAGLEINPSITLEDDETQVPWDPTLEITIYRLVQEAMTNVVKHACATAVSVTVGLSESGDVVTVEVSDNGRGFDAGGLTDGFGLAGLRERVFLAGGQIEVHSIPAGTQLSASLPVSRQPAS
jgi:signal transduction histidine kinase